jgi:hypothetical protein
MSFHWIESTRSNSVYVIRGEAVQKLQQRIRHLRNVAARTVPHEPKSKKKLPADITAALEAIVRLFYIESEASTNTNKAKKAIWTVLFPLMAPWAAETTVKTKMQMSNSRILGAYAIEKEKFCDMASVCGALRRLNLQHADAFRDCLQPVVSMLWNSAICCDWAWHQIVQNVVVFETGNSRIIRRHTPHSLRISAPPRLAPKSFVLSDRVRRTFLLECAAADVAKLNEPAVVAVIGNFVHKFAEMEAVALESPEAEEKVWQRSCELWRAAGGFEVSTSVLKQLVERHTPNSVTSVW